MSQDPDYSERRTRQRFVARRWGAVCFWVSIDGGERQALNDLSLEGFSYPLDTPPAQPQRFAFSLHLEGIPDTIRGQAETMNHVFAEGGGQLGCRFLSFDDDGERRLVEIGAGVRTERAGELQREGVRPGLGRRSGEEPRGGVQGDPAGQRTGHREAGPRVAACRLRHHGSRTTIVTESPSIRAPAGARPA